MSVREHPGGQNPEGVARMSANLPSLGDLDCDLRSKRFLARLMNSEGPTGRPYSREIATGYVRIVEKSALEYKAFREQILEHLSEGSSSAKFRAEDHFESCINSLHRSIVYLDQLRRMGFHLPDGAPFIPRARDLEVLRPDVEGRVRAFRDSIEHLDRDILAGRIRVDAEAEIRLTWETADLGGTVLRYTEVARWIENLHQFASLLARVEIVVAPRSAAA